MISSLSCFNTFQRLFIAPVIKSQLLNMVYRAFHSVSLLGFPKLSRAPLSLQCHLPARLNLPCPRSLPAPTAASVCSPGAPARWYTDARALFSCPLFIVPQDSVSASLPLQAKPWADVTLLYTCPAFSTFPIKTIVIMCFITSLPCTFCEIRDTSVCLVQAA